MNFDCPWLISQSNTLLNRNVHKTRVIPVDSTPFLVSSITLQWTSMFTVTTADSSSFFILSGNRAFNGHETASCSQDSATEHNVLSFSRVLINVFRHLAMGASYFLPREGLFLIHPSHGPRFQACFCCYPHGRRQNHHLYQPLSHTKTVQYPNPPCRFSFQIEQEVSGSPSNLGRFDELVLNKEGVHEMLDERFVGRYHHLVQLSK